MSSPSLPNAILCDFNGTMTNRDMLAALVDSYGHHEFLRRISDARSRGLLSLRERIAAEARVITCTLDEADARLTSLVEFDTTFIPFYRQRIRGAISLTIVSSGIEELIVRTLDRHGIRRVPLFANGVEPRPDGWRVLFRDSTPEGNAKRPYVEAAQRNGYRVVAIGDDESDFAMALVADVRFAKRASPLHRFLEARGVSHHVFNTFDDVSEQLAEQRLLGR